ncbi:MAG: dihydrodipicolinate synthase family protein [Alphaproteobacteria bacterium]|nr:dihydrodipicolinate synthase family protein [Alphaproteobacteria bacterium]
MDATRRDALGMVGAAAAGVAFAGSALAQGAARNLGSKSKTLFWVASCTPCDKNLKFDPAAFKDVLGWFQHNGADGVVVLGTTGEYPSFSMAERKAVMEVAGKNKGGMNIICSSGTSNFPETIELSKHAADHGADGLLVIPPFYYKNPPLAGLIRYYSLLFDAVPQSLAVNLYHIPSLSAVPISHELLKALKHYPNLAGIKDSEEDLPQFKQFVAAFPDLNMRSGTDTKLEFALSKGMGAILAEGNLFCRQIADMFAAFRAGKDSHAAFMKFQTQQALMRKLGGEIDSYGPMKYALSQQMGVPQFYQRPPNLDVTDAQKAAIRKGLAQIKEMG